MSLWPGQALRSSRAGGGLAATAFAFGVSLVLKWSPCSVSVPCWGRCGLVPKIVTLDLMVALGPPGLGSGGLLRPLEPQQLAPE